MKQVNGYEVREYVYESREERERHIKTMDSQGWMESGTVKRIKPDVNIMTATENDYEWYAHFQRFTK